jgi:hypothetical protein
MVIGGNRRALRGGVRGVNRNCTVKAGQFNACAARAAEKNLSRTLKWPQARPIFVE